MAWGFQTFTKTAISQEYAERERDIILKLEKKKQKEIEQHKNMLLQALESKV